VTKPSDFKDASSYLNALRAEHQRKQDDLFLNAFLRGWAMILPLSDYLKLSITEDVAGELSLCRDFDEAEEAGIEAAEYWANELKKGVA
jgi:hypothetical protein